MCAHCDHLLLLTINKHYCSGYYPVKSILKLKESQLKDEVSVFKACDNTFSLVNLSRVEQHIFLIE